MTIDRDQLLAMYQRMTPAEQRYDLQARIRSAARALDEAIGAGADQDALADDLITLHSTARALERAEASR